MRLQTLAAFSAFWECKSTITLPTWSILFLAFNSGDFCSGFSRKFYKRTLVCDRLDGAKSMLTSSTKFFLVTLLLDLVSKRFECFSLHSELGNYFILAFCIMLLFICSLSLCISLHMSFIEFWNSLFCLSNSSCCTWRSPSRASSWLISLSFSVDMRSFSCYVA